MAADGVRDSIDEALSLRMGPSNFQNIVKDFLLLLTLMDVFQILAIVVAGLNLVLEGFSEFGKFELFVAGFSLAEIDVDFRENCRAR